MKIFLDYAQEHITLRVTDANGCTANANATVTEPSAIVLIPSWRMMRYVARANGDAGIGASGGTITSRL